MTLATIGTAEREAMDRRASDGGGKSLAGD